MASEGNDPGEDTGTAEPAAAADAYPRLRHIEITNYKALDHLAVDIPAPRMPGDPDIFVVGSKNGLGKTSLLECCALIHLKRRDAWRADTLVQCIRDTDQPDLQLARDPRRAFHIAAHHDAGTQTHLECPPSFSANGIRQLPRVYKRMGDEARISERLFGRTSDVLLLRDVLLFHSYRKVSEGLINTKDMLSRSDSSSVSAVKLRAVRLFLASHGLVEGDVEGDAERRIDQLNTLLTSFTGGRIDTKLRPVGNDQLDLRIVTPRGTTFSFDALSSGQKEIVTTLFLIWNDTLAHPALVLIDEPELHLNAEWQREFLRHLLALAPANQYILATHSEDIFASVSEERRVLLEASHG